jgi:endonuclease/exonuclease/phosphatase family metal-dependent hydrolase
MGSASEPEYPLLLAGDLNLLKTPDYRRLDEATQAKRRLTSLTEKLRADGLTAAATKLVDSLPFVLASKKAIRT